MEIRVEQGQTIFDVCLVCYQDAAKVFDLLSDNPQIEDVNSDLSGMTLTYTPSFVTQKEVVKINQSTQKNVTIPNTQTLFDISLQYLGSAERIIELVINNGLDSVLSDPAGIILKYTQSNEFVPAYFRKTGGIVANKEIKYTPSTDTNYRISIAGNRRISGPGNYRIWTS